MEALNGDSVLPTFCDAQSNAPSYIFVSHHMNHFH
jgi:hypothetical protein